MNVKQLIEELKKLPPDSEIRVLDFDGNSMDDQIDTFFTSDFEIVHDFRKQYDLVGSRGY